MNLGPFSLPQKPFIHPHHHSIWTSLWCSVFLVLCFSSFITGVITYRSKKLVFLEILLCTEHMPNLNQGPLHLRREAWMWSFRLQCNKHCTIVTNYEFFKNWEKSHWEYLITGASHGRNDQCEYHRVLRTTREVGLELGCGAEGEFYKHLVGKSRESKFVWWQIFNQRNTSNSVLREIISKVPWSWKSQWNYNSLK